MGCGDWLAGVLEALCSNVGLLGTVKDGSRLWWQRQAGVSEVQVLLE